MLSILQVGLIGDLDKSRSTFITFHERNVPHENIHSYVHELVFTTLDADLAKVPRQKIASYK